MKSALVLAGAFATLVGVLVKTVLGPMAQEEAATRLGQLPVALIHMAAARLPRELRDDLTSEWLAELHYVLHGTEGMPLTRLTRGIRYSAGLLISAPAVADGLKGRTTRLSRCARLIGCAATTAGAICLVTAGWGYFHPSETLSVVIYSTHPEPQLTANQLTLTGISCLCGAAALLGTATLLATRRWPLANLNTLCFVAAGVLSYLGGGPEYSMIVATIVFAILGATVPLQVRTWRRTQNARSSAWPAVLARRGWSLSPPAGEHWVRPDR